jgi:molybdate transport system ATP-binding protein
MASPSDSAAPRPGAPAPRAGNAEVLVEVRGLTVRREGSAVLKRLDWRVRRGEHWAVVGPSGSGKSALAEALLGEVLVAEGQVVYPLAGERAPEELPPGYVRRVSFSDQRELVASTSSYLQGRYESLEEEGSPLAGSLLPAACGDVLERLGLGEELLRRRVPQLSNGEMRKLLIAQALLRSPRLLILDEPLQGLDVEARRQLRLLLQQAPRLGVTLVLLTSRRRDVIPPVRRVLLLPEGAASGRRGRAGVDSTPRREPALPVLPGRRRKQGAVLVDLRRVTVSYDGTAVLHEVSWKIRSGEHWALVGPNGAGKTTLLSLILADHPQAYANDVRVFGRRRGEGISIWEVKSRLGHVSPEMQVHFRAGTALETICSGFFDSIGLHQRCSAYRARKARAWAGLLGLAPRLERSFASLSEGERRLVLLARALVKSPRLLVLDEPCQGLDDEHCERVRGVLEAVARARLATLIYVTHEPAELPSCITHRLRLEGGRVAEMQDV